MPFSFLVIASLLVLLYACHSWPLLSFRSTALCPPWSVFRCKKIGIQGLYAGYDSQLVEFFSSSTEWAGETSNVDILH